MPNRATRRTFLKLSAAAASLSAVNLAHAAPSRASINIDIDPNFPLATSEPVQWAADQLREALTAKGISLAEDSARLTVSITSPTSPEIRRTPGLDQIAKPESIAVIPVNSNPRTIYVTGSDTRGIVYALLELADRVRTSDDPIAALRLSAPIIETTPNKVRSVARAFCSEIEDKSWFYDRAFWTTYLDTLASARFNRFAFTLGIAYDFPRGVTGDYLHFPYPYLVEVPGYEQVHVEPALQPGERQRNLETLQFIAAETARRGMDFQLGIWTHAYQWTDSPHSDHHIVGLTPETHATYCRDALAMLLKACPQIKGLTLRIHGESGIPEGSYPFWTTLFEAIKNAGRTIEIDMHAKGLNQEMIDIAHSTGMPVKAGAKFWAEHLGLGYQQTDIRATEYPRAGVSGTFAVSSGLRNFTRYGYGDFYQYPQGTAESKGVDLLYRVWPGTQRHLLWADPALASGYGRAANFCGAAALELMEPLFFKGREGSGHPGGRDAYVDASLSAPSLDTDKFTLTYLTWGRYLYNPGTAPDFYHRALKQAYGPAGPALETALAASSRILPLVTTAWCPSASNHEFWPEMLTPVSILPYTTRPLYTDSPAPHNVSAISPLDPQLFTTIAEHAQNLVYNLADPRYNTSEVIDWLENLVATSSNALAKARTSAGAKARTPEFRRAEEDILILNGLGSFYANLFRAGLFYAIAQQHRDGWGMGHALNSYRLARNAWSDFSSRAKNVYTSDVSYGRPDFRRGHWADRLTQIESDVKALDEFVMANDRDVASAENGVQPATVPAGAPDMKTPSDVIAASNTYPPRPNLAVQHTPADAFHPGSDLAISLSTLPAVRLAILWYRHVNHGERWLSMPMKRSESRARGTYSAAIPAAYTGSPYPLQYYFELRTATSATLHPAFNATWSNQPYYAIHKRT